MNKKELFYKYTDFTNLQGIGANWVNQIRQWLPQSTWLDRSALLSLYFSSLHIKWLMFPAYAITIFLGVKYYFMMFANWYYGKIAIKVGVYEAQQQYNAKKEHLSPYNVELIKQLEAIGEKLGIESKFTKL